MNKAYSVSSGTSQSNLGNKLGTIITNLRLVLKVALLVVRNIAVTVWRSLQMHLEVSLLTEQGLKEDSTVSARPSVRCYLVLVTIFKYLFHAKCEQTKNTITLSHAMDTSSSA